jgi:hypothetical protein
VAEVVVGEEGSPSPRPVAAEAEAVETRVPDEPATVVQGSAAPETMTRAISPEIREAKEMGASLSQGAVGGEAQTLELACTSWAASSGLDVDSEDNEEAAVCNTLERRMTWARRAFDELILGKFSYKGLTSRFRGLLGLCHLSLFCWLQTLESSCRRHAREVRQLRVERTQLEMQIVMAQVAVAGAVASETSARASLEAAR